MLIVNACSVTSNTDSDFNPCQSLNLANSPPFLKILHGGLLCSQTSPIRGFACTAASESCGILVGNLAARTPAH